jgi:KUP system potassium uptake protein
VALVLAFKSSTNLAAAYGIAVTGTMLVTTVLVGVMAVRAWKWGWKLTLAVMGSFIVVDLTLLSANMVKFLQGGWVPLVLAS